jgi:acyl-CoA thioesterase-1
MVDAVQSKLPDAKIILAGMKIPPNMGPEYTSKFESIFPELATSENIKLIPFLLNNVAGIPELNQGDGIHPTVKGQKLVAENVWKVLKPIL